MTKLSVMLMAGAAGLAVAGAAQAGEPIRLSADQMDEITAALTINDLRARLSWAASTAWANGAGNTSASSSTSNSSETEDTLNETRNTSGALISASAVSRRIARSSTSASGSGTSSTASGRGYASAGDLDISVVLLSIP